MSEEKKQEKKENETKPRQIIIETDGNLVRIIKAEVAGTLEFRAILNSLINYCDNQPPK
jgi:hypothetical protein